MKAAFKGREKKVEQEKFVGLANQYKDMVYRMALHCCGSSQDADDVVQEVMVKLWKTDTEFESPEHVRYWLIRVTVNHSRNLLRSLRLRRYTPLEEVDLPVQFETRKQSELYQAVMALPERYRSVLYLFYYEELPVNEIACVLGLSVTAVTTRLSRARAKLKIYLTEGWQDEE